MAFSEAEIYLPIPTHNAGLGSEVARGEWSASTLHRSRRPEPDGLVLRILLVVHQFLPKRAGGTEVLVRDTGLEMLRRGHEVHVLTADPEVSGNAISVSYEDYAHKGLQVHALGVPRRGSFEDKIRDEYDNGVVFEHVSWYVNRIKPDAVHIFHLLRLSGSVIDVFRDLGVPVVFTPTDFWAICVRVTLMKPSGELSSGPDDISSNCLECRSVEKLLPPAELPDAADKQAMYRHIAERALARSEDEHPSMALVRAMLARTRFLRESINTVDAILAPTKLMRNTLVANGVRPELIRISPYGMDVSSFRTVRGSRAGLENVRIGYIGAVNPQKGLHVLLEAFKMLPGEAGVTLRICGDLRTWPDYARRVYAQAEGDNRINFAGPFPNEQMADELARIDVLVVPSLWYENAPLVIYSAIAAGIPVVASNHGGMAEVIDEKNGLLFEPGNPEDLARQLQRLITEPGYREHLGGTDRNIRTVEESVDEMLNLYRSML